MYKFDKQHHNACLSKQNITNIIPLHKTAIWEKLGKTLHVPRAITAGVHMVFLFCN